MVTMIQAILLEYNQLLTKQSFSSSKDYGLMMVCGLMIVFSAFVEIISQ